MLMPSGAHLPSWLASAELNEPLRSEPEIVITFTLSAMVALKFARPSRDPGCAYHGRRHQGERPARKASLQE